MTHFGLLCPAAPGHLNPMTTLGHALRQRGHTVTLIGPLDAAARATAAGLGFQPVGVAEFPAGATRQALARIGACSGLAALRATMDLLRQSTAIVLREAPSACRELGVEALLIDQASFGAATVADSLDLPAIRVCSALLLDQEPGVPPFNSGWPYNPGRWARWRNRLGQQLLNRLLRPISDLVAEHRRRIGLPPLPPDGQPRRLLAQISQQPAAFEYPRQQLPACHHFTGPLSDPASRATVPFPWEQLSGQPLIYASLGTIQNRQLDLYATIATACRDLDAQLVIALGGGSDPRELPPLPGQPLVVAMAPQLELLAKAALTITHAGLNTVLESLSHGVPMVAIPITNDQPGVAARIAWTGSGAVLPLRRLSAERLQAAIRRVLADDAYGANARRLQQAIAQAGGVQRAADIVEAAWAQRGLA